MEIISDNHKALVCKVHVREFPGADRLQLGLCNGFQVIVGKEVQDGTLGLFFQEGLQISEEFAKANDLVRRKDEQGNACGGMFDENRRVRTIKLRGQQSFGFWIPLDSLYWFLDHNFQCVENLKEGDLLDEFAGVKLCSKYITKATRNARTTQRSTRRGEVFGMPKHFDTVQFKREYEKIPEGARVILSCKLHGTSQRVVKTYDKRILSKWEKFKKWLGFQVETECLKYITGTRNVIVSDDKDGFHSNDMRARATAFFEGKLPINMAVYFEVVGYEREGVPIMPRVSSKCLKDKEFTKRYGETITYKYGCPDGTLDVYVYRITQTTNDGHVIELSWEQVKAYCDMWGVKHVPEISNFIFSSNHYNEISGYPYDYESLMELAIKHSGGPDVIDSSHPREGICIRWEKGLEFGIQKLKNFEFLEMEHSTKDDEDCVDMEECS